MVDHESGKEASFGDLLEVLPKDRVRYVFFECNYKRLDDQINERILFVSWCPGKCDPPKEKMLCSSTLKRITSSLQKRYKHVSLHDYEEMTEDNFINVVSSNREK